MKYIVDDDLKSICDEIADLNLSCEEWLQHDKRTFWRGSCVGVYLSRCPPGGAFRFKVRGSRDLTCDSLPLRLEEVLKISDGQTREIQIRPPYQPHPEDAGMRRVEVDPEVLFNAINDAINVFVREALIRRGLVNAEAYFNDPEIDTLKRRIAKHWAENWTVSWKHDAAPKSQPGM